MTKAYSYIRFSTPEQLKGDSLRRQRELSEKYCQEHQLTLDDSLHLRDLGISAYKGKNVREGALAAFLEAVRLGKIAVGSVLVVESLDRLSRAEIGDALTLFIGILNSGVNIITLNPEREYSRKSVNDVAGILEPIIVMARAHEESEIKSHRLSSAWEGKRRLMRSGERKLTARCPAWLRISTDHKTFQTIPQAVDAVKRIFDMAVNGYGIDKIAKQFNAERVEAIGRVNTWHRSYVTKILKSRAVLGEFQPHTVKAGSKRTPLSEPITDYYPSIISESDFYKAQQAMSNRKNHQHGRSGNGVASLFTGLTFDARDHGTMVIVDKGQGNGGKLLLSSSALRGEPGSKFISLSYAIFEKAILDWLKEVRVSDLASKPTSSNEVAERLSETEGQIAKVENKIAATKTAMLGDGDFTELLDVLGKLDGKKKELIELAKKFRAEIHAADNADLTDAQSLVELLNKVEGDELMNLRTRLKGRIVNIIDRIWLLVEPVGQARHVHVQINFKAGSKRWTYFVYDRKGLKAISVAPEGTTVGLDLSILRAKYPQGIPMVLPRRTVKTSKHRYSTLA